MMPPSIAVIIVNFNAGDLLSATIDGLARQELAPTRVIVVDNASTDGSAERAVARLSGAELLALEENVGFAAGNNRGAALATDCDWIALLNPDAVPEPDWLARMADAIHEFPNVPVFGALLLDMDRPDRLDGAGDILHIGGLAWRHLHGHPRTEAPTEPVEVFSPCAAAALYRRAEWDAAGGLDESFFCYFEDIDLAFRIRLMGGRCLLIPAAVVHHHGSAVTGRESDFTIYHSHRNLVWVWARDMPFPLIIRGLVHHILITLLTFGFYASRGQAGVLARAKRDALAGLPRVLRERRRLQRTRRVSPAAIDRVLGHGTGLYRTALERARRRPEVGDGR